tara:strand:+ start:363 stop:560 length:198 start_codon:yes stop_codon:yes gene_type:complete
MKIDWETDEERNQLLNAIFVENFEEFEKVLKQRHLEDWEKGYHNIMDFYKWVVFFAHAYLYEEEE